MEINEPLKNVGGEALASPNSKTPKRESNFSEIPKVNLIAK
jgi:hypothetical protein